MQTIAAGEFKAKCLGVMAEVNSTGRPVVVTKRGQPFVRVLPVEEPAVKEGPESIFGFMQGRGTINEDILSSEFSDEEWEKIADERWERAERGIAQ
ncbi:MAG: type II toxin-antitoxin system Phd/YefM family antitoxin [Terracidiphilus sp.]